MALSAGSHVRREFLLDGATTPVRDYAVAHVCYEDAEVAESFPAVMVVIGGFGMLKYWQGEVRGSVAKEGEAGEGGRVSGRHPRLPHVPGDRRHLQDRRKLVEEVTQELATPDLAGKSV